MADKDYLSNIENARVPEEEPFKSIGKHVIPKQIWRYASLIKGKPSEHTFSKENMPDLPYQREYASMNYGNTILPLITHFINYPLTNKIEGSDGCSYQDDNLKNFFGEEFDESVGQLDSWRETICLENKGEKIPLGYKVGDPIIDPETGVLTFRNKAAITSLLKTYPESKFLISFYKYSGKKGVFGSEEGESLPFADDTPLIKNASNDRTTATFKVRGNADNNSNYVLPPVNLSYDKYKGKGLYGRDKVNAEFEGLPNTGVVVLEENLNDIIWETGKIDGGLYIANDQVSRD